MGRLPRRLHAGRHLPRATITSTTTRKSLPRSLNKRPTRSRNLLRRNIRRLDSSTHLDKRCRNGHHLLFLLVLTGIHHHLFCTRLANLRGSLSVPRTSLSKRNSIHVYHIVPDSAPGRDHGNIRWDLVFRAILALSDSDSDITDVYEA